MTKSLRWRNYLLRTEKPTVSDLEQTTGRRLEVELLVEESIVQLYPNAIRQNGQVRVPSKVVSCYAIPITQ